MSQCHTRYYFMAMMAWVYCTPITLAQTSTGTVDGTVVDSSGGFVPRVKIKLVNTGTGFEREAETDNTGRFRFAGVAAGSYHLEAQATGFKTAEADFKTDVAGVQTLNLMLSVGQVTETLAVTSAVQRVNTEEATLSGVVLEHQVQNLPLNGRDVFTLEILQPGVTQALTARIANFTATDSGINWAEGKYSFNTAGHPVTANDYTLDGLSNNSPIYGGKPGVTPTVDSTQEFRMLENNFSAEYGRNSGAVVNVVTKTGTNQFHGTAYWFLRNSYVDARTVFDPSAIAPLRQSQAGFTAGGPVIRNKTFFFFGFEGFHQFKGSSQIGSFETPELRALVHQIAAGSPADRLFQTYPGPPIQPGTARDIGSPSTTYAIPGPKDGIPDIGLASYVTNSLITMRQYNLRLDHKLSDKNQLFGRYTWGPADTSPIDPRSPELGLHETGFRAQGVLGDTHILSQNQLNEFRWGYTRNRITDSIARFSQPSVAVSANAGGDNINGFANVGVPSNNVGEEYSLSDIFSVNLGRHALKFGYEHHWNQDNGNRYTSTNGGLTYRGLMDFAANLADTATVRIDPRQTSGTPVPVGTPDDYRQQDNGVFAQDNWRVTRRLSLNLGLRYDRYGAVTETHSRIGLPVLGAGSDRYQQTMNAVVSRASQIFHPANELAPRFGFAWDATGDGKTSLRGGYGVAYDRIQFLAFRGSVRFNPPDSTGLSLAVRTLAGPLGVSQTQLAAILGQTNSVPFRLPAGTTSQGFNAGGGPVIGFTVSGNSTTITVPTSVNGQDPKQKQPYSQDWFLSVQRELPAKVILEAAYIGNTGRHLTNGTNYNRFNGDLFGVANPYNGASSGDTGLNYLSPYLTTVSYTTYDLNSSYNGGFISIHRRFSGGFSFQASYTRYRFRARGPRRRRHTGSTQSVGPEGSLRVRRHEPLHGELRV